MRQTGNDNLIWHLSFKWNLWLWSPCLVNQTFKYDKYMYDSTLQNSCQEINFTRQKWKYSRKVFHWPVNLFYYMVRFFTSFWDCDIAQKTVSLTAKPWNLGGLLINHLLLSLITKGKNCTQYFKIAFLVNAQFIYFWKLITCLPV